ncbi:MAG: hypothetical protein N2691_02055 [Patescibacteria group bacterium]|nr:hypothetical protein [Patescibacteria group bacterium]
MNAQLSVTSEITTFDQPVSITFKYSDTDIAGVSESELSMYRWNGSAFNELADCVVNAVQNSVTCATTEFSAFGLYEPALAPTNTPTPTETPPPAPSATPTIGASPPSIGTGAGTAEMPAPPVCQRQAPGAKAPWIYSAISESPTAIRLYFAEADPPLTHYVLAYGTTEGGLEFGAEPIGGQSSRNYLVEHLWPSTRYYFRIRAGNGCASGPWSNEISAKTVSLVSFRNLALSAPIPSTPTPTPEEPALVSITKAPKNPKDDAGSKKEAQRTVTIWVRDKTGSGVAGVLVRATTSRSEGTTNDKGIVRLPVTGTTEEFAVNDNGFTGSKTVALSAEDQAPELTLIVERRVEYFPVVLVLLVVGAGAGILWWWHHRKR